MTTSTDRRPARRLSKGQVRVVSGGQTGVDRAALDAALAVGVAVGGWCPAGRRAEDGPIPERYPLRETASGDPAERTRLNVRDSDATLVLAPGAPTGGTARTVDAARALGKPLAVVAPQDLAAVRCALAGLFAVASGPSGRGCLNVAGPRESEAPGVYAQARATLAEALRALADEPGGEG